MTSSVTPSTSKLVSTSIEKGAQQGAQNNNVDTKSTGLIQIEQLGEHIELKEAQSKLSHHYFCQQYKDALYVSLPRGHVFIFDYGFILTWSVLPAKLIDIRNSIKASVSAVEHPIAAESWQYAVKANEPLSIRDEFIHIPNKEALTLLAVSHALAQSRILEYFEIKAQHTIAQHSHLTRSLANKGTIPLTRNGLSKERGQLFQTKSDILLHFNLLDTPEFFWHYPEQEHIYTALSKYLEIKPRVELLNLKLSTITELLDMLANEQHHKHSAFLEWIIIVLIAVDIAVYFVG